MTLAKSRTATAAPSDKRPAEMRSHHSADGTFLRTSDGARTLLGYAPEELVGRTVYSYVHPDDLAMVAAGHARVLGAETVTLTYRARHRDGHYLWVTTSAAQRSGAAGIELDAMTMASSPPTGLQAGRRPGEHRLTSLMARSTDLAAVLSGDSGTIEHANQLLETCLGAPSGALVGRNFFEFCTLESLGGLVGVLGGVLHRPGAAAPLRFGLRRVRGNAIAVSGIAVNLVDDDLVRGVVLVLRVEATPPGQDAPPTPKLAEFEQTATLARRPELLAALTAHLANHATGPGSAVALIAIRLLDLEAVSSALGPAASAALVDLVIDRIRTVCAPDQLVARHSAATVMVVLPRTQDLDDVRTFGDRLRARLRLPFFVDGTELFSTPKLVAGRAQPGASAAGLLAATVNTLDVIEPGPGVLVFETSRSDDARARLQLSSELHHAIERAEFVLCYQPHIDVQTGAAAGVEALIRWQHPERGLLSPAEFIALAEDSDFISPLGIWVLHEACRQLKAWDEAGPPMPGLRMSINVSANQLNDHRFAEAVCDALKTTGIDPDRLCLEITETALFLSGRTDLFLRELAQQGLRISIDDFGTGHAGLDYLRRVPAHQLKIDRSFINGICQHPGDAAIVTGIIGLAQALGLEVVAEGVETQGQLAELRRLGCHYAQGFLIAKPMFAEEFHRWVGTRQHK